MLTAALLIASGVPFFIGLALCAMTFALSFSSRPRPILARTSALTGVLFVSISATPLDALLLAPGAIGMFAWLALPHGAASARIVRFRRVLGGAVAAIAMIAAILEIPRMWTPRLAPTEHVTRVAVVGDSLSAGIDERVPLWPAMLAADTGVTVSNHARAGASLAAALKQADAIQEGTDVAILLIGGNDMLWGRRSADFERDLDALLTRVQARCNRIVMLELPAPPLGDGYIAAQRRLALRHGVLLIPRWRLAAVLGAPGATIDGLHLSASGQRALADVVMWVLRANKRETATSNTQQANLTSRTDASTVAEREVAGRTIRMLTWNICKCERGIGRIADALRREDADIICLQELIEPRDESSGERGQTKSMADELGMHQASFGGPLDAARNQCIAVLSRWPIHATVRLGSDPNRNWGTAAHVETPNGMVRVVSVHLAGTYKLEWTHIVATTRARQQDWRELLEYVSTIEGPLIIAGDFNVDARTLGIGETSGLQLLTENRPTFPSFRPALRLDHVFARDCAVGVQDRGRLTSESDHNRVILVLNPWVR